MVISILCNIVKEITNIFYVVCYMCIFVSCFHQSLAGGYLDTVPPIACYDQDFGINATVEYAFQGIFTIYRFNIL